VYFSPYRLKKSEISEVLDRLAGELGIDRSVLGEKVNKLKWRGDQCVVAKNLSMSGITPLMEKENLFPGITIRESLQRRYPLGDAVAHVTGYIGPLPPNRVDALLEQAYNRNDFIGLGGIEKQYEELLRGTDGVQIVVRNARGKVLESNIEQPAIPGHNIYLSIDSGLQQACWKEIQGKHGVIIAADPRNGEILALASAPSFDPEKPGATLPDMERSMFNRAIQGRYAPGSTIKPIFAIAALEQGIDPEKRIYCSGKYYLPNWNTPFLCNEGFGHENVNLVRSLEVSCNTYYYTQAQNLGGSILANYANRYGLGRVTGVDLPFEKGGYIPLGGTSELQRGLLVQFSIGQGKIEVTPLQMVRAFIAVANGGRLYTPHLIRKVLNDKQQPTRQAQTEFEDMSLSKAHSTRIRNGLFRCVNSSRGTAHRAQFKPEWKAAGKTGSVQNPRGNVDAWFICFAPYENPNIVLLVMIEDGGLGGRNAAPIAQRLLDSYYSDRKPTDSSQ
jgi:penicillin-binding protein 2